MLKITAEEVNFIIYQFLHESGKYKRSQNRNTFCSKNDSNFTNIFKNKVKKSFVLEAKNIEL